MVKVEKFEKSCNCYFVTDDKAGVSFVVDTGEVCHPLEKRIEDFGADKLKYILLTHGHYDHIAYVADLKKKYPNAEIVIGEKEKAFTHDSRLNLSMFSGVFVKEFNADILVNDGTVLDFGEEKIHIYETPGHTTGSVCYSIGDKIFTGDTLFYLSMGRTDFPTGNASEIKKSLKKLSELEGNFNVYCGHGDVTTLDFERKNNPYMRDILL